MAGYHWGIRFNYRNAPEFILLCTRVRRLYVWTCSTKKERPLWCSRTHHVFFYGAVTVDDEAIDCSLRRYMARESSLNPLRKGRYVPGDFFIPFFPLDAFFLFFLFPFAISIYLQGPALCARVYKSHFLFCHCRLETSPTFCRWCVFVCVYLSSFGCIAR